MASVIKVYKAASYKIHQAQNGELTYEDFNLQSELAELAVMAWLTGSPNANQQPTPFDNQKSYDWLSPAIKDNSDNVVGGKITKPLDYYKWDNMSVIDVTTSECEDDDEGTEELTRVPVEILTGDSFNVRKRTYIKALKPSVKKPIAKEVGKSFEFAPEDLGTIKLEYVAYPEKYGKIVTKVDPVYNEEVPDESVSDDYIWGDWCIEILAWFISDAFANRTRDASLKNMNAATGKVSV